MNIKKLNDYCWEIPKTGAMNVPGRIFTSEKMIDYIIREEAAQQLSNVASLPGIVGYAMAMPDVHWGYGFPIGGVAAFDLNKGVISPGGIGYDINCGVRLLRTDLKIENIKEKLSDIINALFTNIPSGVGSTGKLNLSIQEVKQVIEKGALWAVKKGYGCESDLEHIEENGQLPNADHSFVGMRAIERGANQLGTLGAGNHFLEIQIIDEIFDENTANVFGLFPGQITIMIHTGSRGLGYQVCDDYLRILGDASKKYNIALPDRQLACAPIDSSEGRRYFNAMSGAANYAWANRQIITHWIRETLMIVLGTSLKNLGIDVVYDVAHNIGKFEEYNGKKLFIHRKGATRSFPAGNTDIPLDYKDVGQPVLVPGTMGTESYILVGTKKAMSETFGSTCHGAGRVMSRTQATKSIRGQELSNDLLKQGIIVKSDSYKTLAEEAPFAYKNVNDVVDICEMADISKKVARLKPIGVIKG